jgi:uncharacterized protein
MTPARIAQICNSSPLVLYAKINRLELLHTLFPLIGIPDAVYSEVVSVGLGRERSKVDAGAILNAIDAGWIARLATADRARLGDLPTALGPGEVEVITLAVERQLPTLLDDREGRRAARKRGLEVIGSAGALRLAKLRGHLTTIRPVLDELRAAGLYLSEAV